MVQNQPQNEAHNQASQGNKYVIVYRLLEEAATSDATGMALETDSSLSKSRSLETLVAKRITMKVHNRPEVSGSATAYFSPGDPMIRKLEDSLYSPVPVEFWFIDQNLVNDEGKYEAEYFQGFVTDFEKTAGSEGAIEASLSYEMTVLDEPVRGYATLTSEQVDVVNYVFRDTIAGSAPEVE